MNKINMVLNTDNPNCKLEKNLLQGATDRVFRFTLHDRAVPVLLSDTAEIEVAILYKPEVKNGVSTSIGSYVLSPNDPDYDVVVKKVTDDGVEYSIVEVPLREMFVTYWGNSSLFLNITEGEVKTYTYELNFDTDLNKAYNPKSLPNNLPSYTVLMKQIQDLIAKTDAQRIDIDKNKADIVVANTDIGKRVKTDLSNLGDFTNIPNGTVLQKKDNSIKAFPVSVDETNKVINARGYTINTDSIITKPNTIKLGTNVSIHENGGFIESHTESLDKDYILVDYLNDPATGSSKPIYYQRGPVEDIVIYPDSSTVMNNVTSINIGVPPFDRQIQSVVMKFANAVTGFKMKVMVHGKDCAYYPSKNAWDGYESGLSFAVGDGTIPFIPFFSSLTEYSITCEIKADMPINLLGNGTNPYYKLTANRITRKEMALMDDIVIVTAIDGNNIEVQMKRKTKAEWESSSYVIASGELAVTSDQNPQIMKIGDGSKTWSQLYETSDTKLKIAINEGNQEYTVDKLLFPFCNAMVNDDGIVTVNTSFRVVDENASIVDDCYIIKVATDSRISAKQNTGNSNAVDLDFKGVQVDSGDTTPVIETSYLSFPDGLVLKEDDTGKVIVNTASEVTSGGNVVVGRMRAIEIPTDSGLKVSKITGAESTAIFEATGPKITVDGVQTVEGAKVIEFPTDGMIVAEADLTDPKKVSVRSKGIAVQKNSSLPIWYAKKILFPHGYVSGTQAGVVTVATGHIVENEPDGELSSTITKWLFPADSNIRVELDPNDPSRVIVKTESNSGIEVAKDESTAVTTVTTMYFPNATLSDGSTTGSIIITTKDNPIIKQGSKELTGYNSIMFIDDYFTINKKNGDDTEIEIGFNGISVESNNVESAGIKIVDFDAQDFNVDGSNEGVAVITSKHKTNNGFLAYYSHRDVVGPDNLQEAYRRTAMKPNFIQYTDNSITYDTNTGIVTLEYSGENGESQEFKIASRISLRRQIKEADLEAYLYLMNMKDNDYLEDINGGAKVVHRTIKKELTYDYIELVTMVSITETTNFKVILKDDSPNKYLDILDMVMGTSVIAVEKVSLRNQPSEAMREYENLTNQSMRFIKHTYDSNFENVDALIESTPTTQQDYPDDTMFQRDGWIVMYQDEGIYQQVLAPDNATKGIYMSDVPAGFGYHNITKVLPFEDVSLLKGKTLKATVKRFYQDGEFMIVPAVWRRKINEYPFKIVVGMNGEGLFGTTDGWEVILADKVVMAESPNPQTDATFTCSYVIPDDAVNVGFILMPTKQQDHSSIKFAEFKIGCDPKYDAWVIEYPAQAIEEQLYNEPTYAKFVQLRKDRTIIQDFYELDNRGGSNIYIGEKQSGGNADVVKYGDNPTGDFNQIHNIGGYQFLKSGVVQIRTRFRIGTDLFPVDRDYNKCRLSYAKDTTGNMTGGTQIPASIHDVTIQKAGNVWTDYVKTNKYLDWTFTVKVEKDDKIYLDCISEAMLDNSHFYAFVDGFTEFNFLEEEYKISELQTQVDALTNLLTATQSAIDNKAYIELDYTGGKPVINTNVRP